MSGTAGPTASSTFNCRVEPAEFDAGVGGGELPVHLGGPFVALLLPRRYLALQARLVLDSPLQALLGQHAQLDLGHVQPRAVARGMANTSLRLRRWASSALKV